MKKSIIFVFVLMFCFISTAKAETKEIIESYEKYIITVTNYDSKGNAVLTTHEEVTEAEAMNVKNVQARGNMECGTDTGFVDCHETNSKRLKLDYYRKSSNANKYYIELINSWLTTPSVQDYDVIAVRWTGTVSSIDVTGTQIAYQGSLKQQTGYDENSSNTKIGTNGVGISMNMYNSSTDHEMTLKVELTSSNPGTVYGTYQHAKNTAVTLAISKSYSFSSSGLGGVLLFSSTTYANYYDKMQGVSGPYIVVN